MRKAAHNTVKLFVSSTFEDMHAERDHLNRFVFPEVRERCRAIGVDFVAIDLRWGVTREEAQAHGTLELCRQEVDRCAPFFIGLVGARYGWVPAPDRIKLAAFRAMRDILSPADRRLLDRSYHLDETTGTPLMRLRPDIAATDSERLEIVRVCELARLPDAGKSLTEIEIDSALRASRPRGMRALFYLRHPPVHRDPLFSLSLVPVFASTGQARTRLARLKRQLAVAGAPTLVRQYAATYAGVRIDAVYLPARLSGREREILEDGVVRPQEFGALTKRLRERVERHGTVALDGLDSWGEQVLRDLWEQIEKVTAAPPRAGRRVEAGGRDHERFLRDRTRLFVGREDLVGDALRFAVSDDADSTLVVSGPPGSGKSTLLAECAARLRDQEPQTVVVAHFIGAAPGTTDLHVTLRSLCERLREECDLEEAVPALPEELEFALARFLQLAAEKRRVVVVIDAVNQLDPSRDSHELRWLPTRLPPNARLIVSALPGSCLDELLARVPKQRVVQVPALSSTEREELIRRTLAERGKRLDAAQVGRLLDVDARPGAAYPLYLLVALEELSIFGDFEGLNRRINRLPEGLPELFDQVLARVELDHGRPLTERVLRALAVARSGLLESEIRDLLDDGADATAPLAWSRLRLALDFYLSPVEEGSENLTGFYHDQLRLAVYRRYLGMEDPEAAPRAACVASHAELAAYFARQAHTAEGGWRRDATRPLAELAFHHVRGLLHRDLAVFLTDPGFLRAKLHAHPPDMLLADFDLLLSAEPPADVEIDSSGLGWIRDALRLSAQVLAQDSGELSTQLWARLRTKRSPAVDTLREGLRDPRTGPWLRPRRTSVNAVGHPLTMTLSGMNSVNGVVVSPDESVALCHDDDSILWLWDLRSGALRRTIETQRSAWINCSARHPTRPLVAAAKNEGGILVVEVEAAEVLRELPSSGELNGVAISQDGRDVWTVHQGGIVECRSIQGGDEVRRIDVESWDDVTAIVAVTGQRAYVAVGGQVQEWDMSAPARLRSIGGSEGVISSLAVSDRERHMAVGWDDGRIDLWDLRATSRRALAGHRDRPTRVDVAGLAFSPDGRRVVSGSHDETLRIWDAAGDHVATLRGHSMAVYGLAIFDRGRRAISVSKDGTARVWDLDAEPPDETDTDFRHGGAVDALTAQAEAGIAASGSRDRVIGLWDLTTGAHLCHWTAHAGEELHEGWIQAISLTPSGERVHSAAKDGTLKTWNVADGRLVHSLDGDWDAQGDVALARDVPLLAGDDGGWETVRLSFWRPGRKTKLAPPVKVKSARSAIALSDDGAVAVSTDLDGGIAVIDAKRRRVLWSLPASRRRQWRDYARCIAIGPDARRAVLGFPGGQVELWDLVKQRKRRIFRLHDNEVAAVAISPDGALACSAGWDWALRVWELNSGTVIASYSNDDWWSSCAFIGDGSRILAGDERGGVHFLELENWPAAERRQDATTAIKPAM